MSETHLPLPVQPTPAKARILSLDFIRGACLIVIAFDHISSFSNKLGYTGRVLFTPTMLGYSSAAELFLFVSGALIGILQAKPGISFPQRFVRLSHRAGHLYLYNALAFVALLTCCAYLGGATVDALGLHNLAQTPGQSAANFLLLSASPPLLDILALYVGYLLVSVMFVPLSLRMPGLAFALSLALYAICQWAPVRQALEPNAPESGLNPYTWQLCFITGLLCGQLGLLARLESLIRRPRFILSALAALVLLTVFFIADRKLGITNQWWWDKHQLGPLRLPHAALVLTAYMWLSSCLLHRRLPAACRWLHEAFASMGRHSLEVFTLGIGVTYAAALLVGKLGLSTPGYYAVLAGVALTLWAFARYLGWRRAVSR